MQFGTIPPGYFRNSERNPEVRNVGVVTTVLWWLPRGGSPIRSGLNPVEFGVLSRFAMGFHDSGFTTCAPSRTMMVAGEQWKSDATPEQ